MQRHSTKQLIGTHQKSQIVKHKKKMRNCHILKRNMETKTKCNIKIYVRFWYRSKYMNRKK